MPRDETVIDIRPTRAMLAYTETTSPTQTGRSSLRRSRCRRAQHRRDRERRVQDGRIYIERVNAPFLAVGGSGEDFRAGIECAIALGWIWMHESGTYVKFTDAGAALFA